MFYRNVELPNLYLCTPTSRFLTCCAWLFVAFLGLTITFEVKAARGDMFTIAGTSGGDGGPAMIASIVNPSGVAVDASGNLYIAGGMDSRIRKVTVSTGLITTVAGSGSAGFSGDGGEATSARLYNPGGVAVDGVGNIYIADSANGRIRKVTIATGLITTVAGTGMGSLLGDNGPAVSATLSAPQGVAVDSVGNIYIADKGTSRIRKVTVANGKITTVAGTGFFGFSGDGGSAINADLDSPTGIALDNLNNIYFIDAGNNRIRKVSAAYGTISTVAGGSAGISGDGGFAVGTSLLNPSGLVVDKFGNIFIADSGSSRVRKVTLDTGLISTVAGNGVSLHAGDGDLATSASIRNALAVALDPNGNLYVAETLFIRKVAVSNQIITTVAGTGSTFFAGDGRPASIAQFNTPAGVALDSAGNVYIADVNNHRIRKLVVATGLIETVVGTDSYGSSGDNGLAINAQLNSPAAIAIDKADNLFICDLSHRIRKVTVATGLITTVAGTGRSGFSGDTGPATSAEFAFVADVAVDGDGNIYISDAGNQRIRKVTAATGIVTTISGGGTLLEQNNVPAISARFYSTGRIALDSVGNLYIVDYFNYKVRKVEAATGLISTIAGSGGHGFFGDGGPAVDATFESISGLATDKLGNIYIADSYISRVRKVTAKTGIIYTVAGTSIPGFSGDGASATDASLYSPNGVALDATGNLYIADTGNNRIRKVIGPTRDSILRLGNDISGDGKSDLIFSNASTGQISAWLMNGTTVTSSADLLGANSGWTPTHTADFNGDGKADILYQHTDGRVAMWLMDGTSLISGAGLLGAASGWSVSHVADFNGDGKADILYRHTDGRVAMWLMNGTTLTSGAGLLEAGSGWSVTHTGDFNGDGKADILFRHTDGRVAMWLMNGAALTSGAGLLGAASGWSVTHTGDFNGDGKADILYRHTDGRVAMWLMDGTALTSGAGLLEAASGWTVTHVADFNGDGKADILYRHTDGRVAMWLMNGITLTSGAGLLGAASGWSVTHTGDYNGDGKADIVYRHADGRIAMWLMNGTALMSGAGLAVPSTSSVVPMMQ